MVGTRRLELLTSTVSKSGYSATRQLTGYLGLPKSAELRDRPSQKRNECGIEHRASRTASLVYVFEAWFFLRAPVPAIRDRGKSPAYPTRRGPWMTVDC